MGPERFTSPKKSRVNVIPDIRRVMKSHERAGGHVVCCHSYQPNMTTIESRWILCESTRCDTTTVPTGSV